MRRLIEPLQDLGGCRRAQLGLADLDVAEIADEIRRRHVVKPERDDVEFPVHRVLAQRLLALLLDPAAGNGITREQDDRATAFHDGLVQALDERGAGRQVDRVVPHGNVGYPGEEVMKPVGLRLVDVRVAEERVVRALPDNCSRHANPALPCGCRR
jgi:hypothetical protein